MKLDKLVGERFRERPAGCVIESHALMVRGGYMKGVANGIFSQYPPLRRVTRKLEQIIREEMDAIEGQEVSMPVVLPGALWEESGRYVSVGSELLRFQDRTGTPMVLGMTHEEAAVQLVREYGRTAARYPFMIYQIQTKFRDEARPRGGLILCKEEYGKAIDKAVYFPAGPGTLLRALPPRLRAHFCPGRPAGGGFRCIGFRHDGRQPFP